MDIQREVADKYQGLFNLMSKEHNLILTISEMDEIIIEAQKVVNEISSKPVLAAVNWEPKFFADIDENAEDGDYLREQQCCTSCGAYTGDLPGYYWIEDSDDCPICRASNQEEKWSEEVRRVMLREKLDEDEINDTLSALAELCGV